jgi:serine/threonine protein kinase
MDYIGPYYDLKKYSMKRTKRLGKGKYGTVFRGKNVKTGQKVAIKRINDFDVFMDELECLENTKEICKDADLLCLEDAFDYGDYYYIITPLLDKYIILYDFIKNTKIKITKKIADTIMKKIKHSIAALRKVNLIHGDLHAGNIMVKSINDNDIDVKLIDLGLCMSPELEEKAYKDEPEFLEKNRLKMLEEALNERVILDEQKSPKKSK